MYLELDALPKDMESLLMVMSNYGGAGMKFVKTLQLRVLDVTAGEEAPRQIMEYKYESQPDKDKETTQILVGKIYKEYASSAFSAWSSEDVKNVLSLMCLGESIKEREDNTRIVLEKVRAPRNAVLAAGSSRCGHGRLCWSVLS